ncbi:nucleotide sugar dehydrogenase [Halobacterium salinarum]|uniref:nucleotide sugar dehydrogenase n=1 Tax=Halobacterium salinarum TaxID=2242 RepID=UPI0025533A3F|nr:nucleotide sugar dehydrogenase [Halobacterium salinarum]MDL0138587.1 nucleotide sugar dehydrogenase [Halobacterium salinarum]
MSSDAIEVAPVDEVVVIGTGFVGLPLALVLAEQGTQVYGVDIDENLVDAINDASLKLNSGEFHTRLEDETVQANLEASMEPTAGDAFVISVPTPLQEPSKSPDLSYVEAAIKSILPYLDGGELINIESTIPPLTCERTVIPILKDAGFEPGTDIQLAHSPERILPGNVFEEIVTNDRVIGGINRESALRAAKIYDPFLEGEIYFTDLTSAELCKLMENTFRDVNVALANEFALIGGEMDVNMDHVIDLANNHPRVDILNPGIGVGGHCLPVDPWFLNEVDPEHTNLITTARRINDKMPDVTAKKVRRAVASYDTPKIVALGATYKPNTYDQRNSPAQKVVNSLSLDGYDIHHYDRHVDGMGYDDLKSLIEDERPDVLLQLVPHDNTNRAINKNRDWFVSNDIELIRFGEAKTPTQPLSKP